MSLRRRIIGIGSPHGDDQVGWRLVERLRSRRDLNVELITIIDPSNLLDHVDDCDHLVLIDSCVTGVSPGTVTHLTWPDARISAHHSHSSHGFGLAEMLQLGQQLGRLPGEVIVFGIELAQCHIASSMSTEIECGLENLEKQLLCEICSHMENSDDTYAGSARELTN